MMNFTELLDSYFRMFNDSPPIADMDEQSARRAIEQAIKTRTKITTKDAGVPDKAFL